ncbi:AI-2E family transporter [Agrococcus sediminis]|uniref:AI-2E family transporter n=1 Tax=Agrococcus sediminis TaxID=2599924 RepID=A0A5M8QN93_9MICO|nr:AI-2E family transporter [Agrococcus sediminis]KAA6436500.1 AI-2E family transporter [Agrococcus sediminis]RWR26013.1 AI-2E family transporter [Agrococcus lahaulensis]
MRWPWQRRRELPPVPQVTEAVERRWMLPRTLIVLLSVIAVFAVLILLSQVASFLAPVFLGFNLVIAVMPLQQWLLRVGAPRMVAALASLLTVYAFLLALLWSIYWSVQSLVTELPGYSARFNAMYRDVLAWLETLGVSQDEALEQLQSAFSPSAIAGAVGALASDAGSALAFVATLFVVVFFLAWDSVQLPERMQRIAVTNPGMVRGIDRFAAGVQRYWVVTTLFGLIVSALDLIALMLLGVPLALVWAVFAFVTNYIPNVGFVLGVIPPTLMALLANGPINALATAILFSVINFVMQSLVQPKVAGDAVGVTPATSFLSLLVWAFALGPIGALLALPSTLAVKTLLIDPDPRLAWASKLMSSKLDAPPGGRLGRAVAPGVRPRAEGSPQAR